MEGLLKIISRKDFHWVHSRVHHIWPDVVESARVLKKDKRFLVGPRKKVQSSSINERRIALIFSDAR